MDALTGFGLATLSGVIVSLVTLYLTPRQRAKEERRAEERRREAVLTALVRELQWNRTAIRGLDAGNAHCSIGKFSTVAFERHGSDLAVIKSGGLEAVFNHYSTVGAMLRIPRESCHPF